MALSPLDAFFDLSPSHLLETEEFHGLERARGMAVDFIEVRYPWPRSTQRLASIPRDTQPLANA